MVRENERLIGYARVSTNEQELSLQVDALLAHGVRQEHLYCDKLSGVREDRPGLTACNEVLRCGDTLVVWRLDRLGRSMRHLVNMIEDLKERGIGFRSISDGMIDTTSASGELEKLMQPYEKTHDTTKKQGRAAMDKAQDAIRAISASMEKLQAAMA